MTTADPPFQFSLRLAFAITLWAAVALLIYRRAGAVVAILTAVGFLHVSVMILLSCAPLPWSTEWRQLVRLGWMVLVPFVPYLMMRYVRFTPDPMRGTSDPAMVFPAMMLLLVFLASPVSMYCVYRATQVSDEALAIGHPLRLAFLGSCMAIFWTPLLMLCGNRFS